MFLLLCSAINVTVSCRILITHPHKVPYAVLVQNIYSYFVVSEEKTKF